MKKRLLCMILAFTMILSLVVPAFASDDMGLPVDFIPTADDSQDTFSLTTEPAAQEDLNDSTLVAVEESTSGIISEDIPTVQQEITSAVSAESTESFEQGGYSEAITNSEPNANSDLINYSGTEEVDQQQQVAQPVPELQEETSFDVPDALEAKPISVLEEIGSSAEADPVEEPSPVRVVFRLFPNWAEIHIFCEVDFHKVEIEPEADGSFFLLPGDYTYSASGFGYEAAENVEFTVFEDRVFTEELYHDVKEPLDIFLVETADTYNTNNESAAKGEEIAASSKIVAETATSNSTAEEEKQFVETATSSDAVVETKAEDVVPEELASEETSTEIAASESDLSEANSVDKTEKDFESESEEPATDETEDGDSNGGFLKWLFTGKSSAKSENEPTELVVTEVIDLGTVVPGGDEDNKERLAQYVSRFFYPPSLQAPPFDNTKQYFTELDWGAYNSLKTQIENVASGEETSTVFRVTYEDLGYTKSTWTAEELEVDAVAVENGESVTITAEAENAVSARMKCNLDVVLRALLVDCPYELYWFDKTVGVHQNMPISLRWDSDAQCYNIVVVEAVEYSFAVAADYSAGLYLVNPSAVVTAQQAAVNARAIINTYAGLADSEILRGYKNAICDRVSYNSAAMEDETTAYGDPW